MSPNASASAAVPSERLFARWRMLASARAMWAVIAITGTLPPASRSKGTNFTQQPEAVHSRHSNVGHHQIRMVIFYCLEAFKRIPRHHDVCTHLIQEETQIPARVVMIFHNDNREIA